MKGNITNELFESSKNPQRRWFWYGIVLILLIVVLCLLLRQCGTSPIPASSTYITQCTETVSTTDSILPTLSFDDNDGFQGVPESPNVTINATSGFVMQAHDRHQEVVFTNDASNPCAFRVSLYLSDGTLLYESGFLLPGESVSEITLTRELDTGLYQNALLLYTMYTVDVPHTAINQCEFPIEIQTK